jgi:DNA-binding CsgD family transcriptional regulator
MSSDDVTGRPLDFADAEAVDPDSGEPAVDRLLAPMADALDRMQQGILLVDAAGRLLFANQQGRDVLAASDGLYAAQDGLQAATPEQTKALRRLIRAASAPDGDSRTCEMIALQRRFRQRPLAVMVASCHPRTRLAAAIRPHGAALVFVSDPDRAPAMQSDLLRRLYRLTRMEAEVALAVLRGEPLKTIAESFGMSLGSVRRHLQDVFDKTETRRQAELILRLRSAPDANPG